jgi:hypothetical protein
VQTPSGERWWNRPVLPYVVLLLAPAATLIVGRIILGALPDCGEDDPAWELRHFELALLPALADLLPFAWLVSRAPGVRRAAIVAGLLGAVRYAIVQGATLIENASSRGQSLNPDCTVSIFFLIWLVLVIFALWLISGLVVAAMLLWDRRTPAA